MIVGDNIQVKWSKNNKSYFEEHGYIFTQYGDIFKVDLKDLKPNMSYKVDRKCDFCGKIFYRMYYLVSFRNRHSCGNKCKGKLQKETSIEKYGCECCLQNEDVHKKIQKTLFDKYNVDEIYKSREIITKRLNTFRDNYSDKDKRKKLQLKKESTRLATTGYRTPFNDPIVREKSKLSLIEHFGVDNPVKSEQILEKIAITKYHNNTVATSKEQQYLYELIKGELNYPIGAKSGDIVFVDEKIVVEYDGAGHFRHGEQLHGHDTFSFLEQEKNRETYIRNKGYKTLHIIDKNCNLFDVDIVVLINKNKSILIDQNVEAIELNLDNGFFKYKNNVLTFEELK